ncbi:hypothetical protein BJX64DRAFT_276964 [Aspergillus heterothallicus]
MISLSNKVIALTGAASGIGRATALLLASLGAKLSIADLQQEALETVAQEIKAAGHGDVLVTKIDVRQPDAVESWIQETVKWGGRLDGAANLAGVIGKSIGLAGIKELDSDEWDFLMDVNLKGLMHCLRAELKVLADNGSVVNAASIAGLMGFPRNAAYCASKHGVIGLSRSVAKEVGAQGIRVNCIAPGAIKTPMLAQSYATSGNAALESGTALGRPGVAEEVANLVAFLLSDSSTFITGSVYSIDGGWNC